MVINYAANELTQVALRERNAALGLCAAAAGGTMDGFVVDDPVAAGGAGAVVMVSINWESNRRC